MKLGRRSEVAKITLNLSMGNCNVPLQVDFEWRSIWLKFTLESNGLSWRIMIHFNMVPQSCFFERSKNTLVTLEGLKLPNRDTRSVLHMDSIYVLHQQSILSGFEVTNITRIGIIRWDRVVPHHVCADGSVEVSSKVAQITF